MKAKKQAGGVGLASLPSLQASSKTANMASRKGLIPKLRQPLRLRYLHRRVKIGYGGNPATVRTFRPWRRSFWCRFKGAGHEEHRIASAPPYPPRLAGVGSGPGGAAGRKPAATSYQDSGLSSIPNGANSRQPERARGSSGKTRARHGGG